jgi:putative protein-disulfide isomerase
MNQPLLWYFADPMCSWCWGFTPVIERIKKDYNDKLTIALVMGGLRPGMTDPITSSLRDELFHHWRDVSQMSGASFAMQGALPNGFIYDTEPAARAVITVGSLNPAATFLYFKAVQSAFYTQNIDVTQTDNLGYLAKQFGVNQKLFVNKFNSDDARQTTQAHFAQTRAYGVRGFPALTAENAKHREVLADGYRSFDEVKKAIDAWIVRESALTR